MRFIPLEDAGAEQPQLQFVPLEEEQQKPQEAQKPLTFEPLQDELTEWKPTTAEAIKDWFMNLIPGDRAKGEMELLARRYAAERKVSVDEAYRQMKEAVGVRGPAGQRPSGQPMFNPQGTPPVGYVVRSAPYVAEAVLEAPKGLAESVLRTYRGGDIEGAVDKDYVDQLITYLGDDAKEVFIPNIPELLGMDKKDSNYQSLQSAGKSFGYSLATMAASAVAGAATTAVTSSPLAGFGAGMTTAGAVAYRGSKDDFLSRVRDKLNKDSKRVFGRPMSDAEWKAAREKFDGAATEYGAWEAVPEAVTNAIFLKAFAAPAATAKGARLAAAMEKAGALALDQIGETATTYGQNAPELKAGLTKDELTVVDAFKQQFLQSLLTAGVMAGTIKASQMAKDFYDTQVLPRVNPGSALAKAIEADIRNYAGYTPAAFRSKAATDQARSEEVGVRTQRQKLRQQLGLPATEVPRGTTPPEEPPAAPTGEPPIAPSGAPGGGRIEPTLGEEPVAPIETRQEPVMGEELTPEQQALVAGYVAQGFTEQEAVERILKRGKRAEIPGLVKPEETISAQEVQARQQAGEAAGLGLTAEATSLLAAVDAGGVPAIMTNNMKRIAAENGIKVTGATTPNDVIEQLRQKVGQAAITKPEGQVAPNEPPMPPAAKPAVTPPQEPSGETANVGMPVVELPLKDLTLSKDVPQFKMGADAKGVVEPLGGKFERTGVAPIQVWRRLDGSLEVISGRHRLDLARRSGEKTIPAQVHDEAQGFTPTMAAVLDAELNIRDGQGKVKDYVNYFKASGIEPQDAESRGLLARATGKRAYTIATTGSDELVAAVRNDQVGDEAAYYIALNAPNDPRLQAVGIQGVMDGKSANLAINTMLAMKALGVENNTTTDMFGFDDSAMKEAAAMAQVANRKQREIQTRLSAISGAAKNPAVAKAEGIDIRDPEAVNRRINELRQMKAAWDNWATNPELIAEIRQDRGVEAPSLTLRGETEEEIRAREETAAAEEKRRRAEEEAAKRAEQEAFDRKRAAETTDLFQLGQTAAQQMSGMGDLFAPPVEEKPAEPVSLDLMKDGIEGREIPFTEVPNGSEAFQYALGRTEEGGKEAIYRRRANERGTYGGWRWEADKPLKGAEPMGQRMVNAADKFRDAVVEQFGLTPEQADKALGALTKEKLVKLDPVTGQFELKSGDVWDRDVMLRAAGEEVEERKPGATDDEVKKAGEEFKAAEAKQEEDGFKMTHIFDAPAKNDVVRLTQKGDFLTPEQARKQIEKWKDNAIAQGKTGQNSDKVVLSLFDLTGAWSEPWVEAGYQVYRFDIQDQWTMRDETTGEEVNLGDIRNFNVQYFVDLFGNFDGAEVYAILAACPCTDFAASGARHFKAKDASGQTMGSVELVEQTLTTIEYFKPSIWALENPVGRIEKLTGLPPWRLSFDPYMFGDPYTKKTLLWGRFNPDLPVAPVEPTEGSKMHRLYGGKSMATKNARSVTPEGFAYSFFQANNAIDHPVMALANQFDRLDKDLFKQAIDAGISEADIREAVEDPYYSDLDDAAAENNLRALIAKAAKPTEAKEPPEIRQARREMEQGVKLTPAVLKRRRALIEWEKSQEPAPAREPEFTADNIVNGEQPAADLPATNRLVFMPCSAKKGGKAGPAMDLYQGVFFQTFRSNVPADAMPNVVILSAEHGFIGPDAQIEPYDRLLDKARADEMLGDMPKVITDIKKAMAGIPADQIKDVLLVGGKEYQAVMRAALAQMKEDGLIPEDASVNATSGGIGEQRQQLGQYLRALPSQAKPVAKQARVVDMTARRQEQIEREEEAEEEATAEESRVSAINRLKKEYKPLAEKIWQATAKAERALKQSSFPNSLEHQALQQQTDELNSVLASFNKLNAQTQLGDNVLNELPQAMELVKSEGKLKRLEELTKRVAEEPPKGISKFKAKKKEEPDLFNVEEPGKAKEEATWSPERVDLLVNEYEYFQGGRENDTKAYAAFINPAEFVRATTGPGELRQELLRAEDGLDMKRLREERQTPFLLVEFVPGEKAMWRIEGHEGRHRMAALAAAGVERVPVLIRMVGEAKAWAPVKEQWLSGQKFGPTSREKGDAVQITDLTPISFARREELQQKFASEGPRAFSVEEPKKPTGWESVPTEREPRVNKGQEEQIREEQIRSYQAIRQRLAAIPRRVAEQRLAPGEHFTVQALLTEAQNLKAAIDASRPKRDTAVDFLAWATKQYADGHISKEVFDVIRAAFDKYPQLLEGLRFSVKQQPEGSSATGQFFSIPRILRLYKGSTGVDAPRTIRHELTHSLEQMMTPEQRKVIVDAWHKDLEKAMQKHTDKAHKDYFDAVLEFMANPSKAAQDKVVKLLPSYDMYQFSNPSEYWAVNAEDLLGMQLGGAWQRFKRVVQRLFEGIKQVLGFDNKSDVHRVFSEIMGGEMKRLDTKMVYHEAGTQALNVPSGRWPANTRIEVTKQQADEFWKAAEKIKRSEGVEYAEEAWSGGIADFGDKDAAFMLFKYKGASDYQEAIQKLAFDKFIGGYDKMSYNTKFYVYRYGDLKLVNRVKRNTIKSDEPIATSLSLGFVKAFPQFAGFEEARPGVKRGWMRIAIDPNAIWMLGGKPSEQELVINAYALGPNDIEVIDESFMPSEPAAFFNIEEDKRLLNKYGKENTPQTEAETTIADFLAKQYKDGRELFRDAVEDPLAAAAQMGDATLDGLVRARMATFWYGAGLESRDFARYKGQLTVGDNLAIASVALDNAIHGANIGIEVLFKGGLAYNSKLGRFVAVDRKKGMHGVYRAERALKNRIGKQLGTDIINGYLEAKRSISIMDELRFREEELAIAKDSYEYMIEQGASEEDIKESRNAMLRAKDAVTAIKRAVTSVTMSDAEMREFAALDRRHPELREILDNFKAVNQNLLKVWYDVGLLSEARYNTLSSIKDYVPWYRIMGDGEDPHTPLQTTTRNLLNIGREKRFKRGAPVQVLDFIVKEGQDTFKVPPSTVVRVEVNGTKVGSEFLSVTPEGELKISMPEDNPLRTGDLVVINTTRQIANIIDNMTQNVMRMTINGIRHYAANRIVNEYATRTPDGHLMTFPSVDEKKGRINYILDGKKVVVEISDPLPAGSLMGLGQAPLDMFAIPAAVSNFTRRTLTLSPAFQLKQVFIDAPNAAVVTGVKHPLLLIGGVMKGLVTALIDPVTKKFGIEVEPAINVLKAAGIGGFHDPSRSPEKEIKQRLGVMNRNVYQAVMRLLDHIGDSSDMAQRVAVYNRVLAETGNETQAVFQAANVMPFLHRGSSSYAQVAVRTIPFMGSSANAIDVFSNALIGGNLKGMRRRKAIARLAQAVITLSTLTLLYAMMNSGDPEYEELDDQTKLRNIIIPGTDVMIPMYSSSAFVWKAIPEMLYNKFVNEGTKNEVDRRRLKEALSRAAIDMLGGPTPVPVAIKAPMEIILDHNFVTGRELIPRNLKNVEAFEQFDARTSELSKWLSKYTEYGDDGKRLLNPIESEHLVRGLFGSLGVTLGWLTNNIAERRGERPEATGRETPVIGAFMQPEVGRLNEDLFYDLKEEVDKKYKTWSLMMDRGEDKEAGEYETKNEKLLDMYQDLNKTNDALGEINSEIRELETAKDLKISAEERRDQINKLRREKMELLDDVIEMRKEAGFDEWGFNE